MEEAKEWGADDEKHNFGTEVVHDSCVDKVKKEHDNPGQETEYRKHGMHS